MGSRADRRSLKSERIKIGVAQHESQADRLAGQGADVVGSLPSIGPLDLIADQLAGIFQRIAGQRMAIGVLNFDADVARRAKWRS